MNVHVQITRPKQLPFVSILTAARLGPIHINADNEVLRKTADTS